MSLLAQLKNDQLTARKNREADKASLLTTLLGEAGMVGKNDGNRESTDEEVIKVIKKFINNANDTVNDVGGADKPAAQKFLAEIAILTPYMPQQMSAVQLASVLAAQFTAPFDVKAKGAMMKYLKDTYTGQYDGKLAAQVIDTMLRG